MHYTHSVVFTFMRKPSEEGKEPDELVTAGPRFYKNLGAAHNFAAQMASKYGVLDLLSPIEEVEALIIADKDPNADPEADTSTAKGLAIVDVDTEEVVLNVEFRELPKGDPVNESMAEVPEGELDPTGNPVDESTV